MIAGNCLFRQTAAKAPATEKPQKPIFLKSFAAEAEIGSRRQIAGSRVLCEADWLAAVWQ